PYLGGPPDLVGPLPPGRRPRHPAPIPHLAAPGRRPPVGNDQPGPVLLARHHQPVEEAVRGRGRGRPLGPPPRPAAVRGAPLGVPRGPLGADVLASSLPVCPQPVVLRGGGRGVAGRLPGPSRAGDGSTLASVSGPGVAAAPPGDPAQGPGPGPQAGRTPGVA